MSDNIGVNGHHNGHHNEVQVNGSDLDAVFLCDEYVEKEWCGLDWRAIRDLIKQRKDDRIILRFDKSSIPGGFGVDAYEDLESRTPKAAGAIAVRVRSRTKRLPWPLDWHIIRFNTCSETHAC